MRAAAGALCIAGAATAVLVSWQQDRSTPATSFVVAHADLTAGDVIDADDITTTPADVGGAGEDRLLQSADQAIGLVVTGPIASGTFITTDRVVAPEAAPARIEVALNLPIAQALGGAIRRGDAVSVYATIERCTTALALDARISEFDTSDDGIGEPSVLLRLSLTDPAQVAAVINAERNGSVTLARGGSSDVPPCVVPNR
jgi:Flp pilus assembly protein CpaB